MENEVMINEEVMDAVVEEVCASNNTLGIVGTIVGGVLLVGGAVYGWIRYKNKKLMQKAETAEENTEKVLDV